MRHTTIMDTVTKIDKFTGENFTPDKFFVDALLGHSFAYSNKSQRLKDVKDISTSTTKLYKSTSEKFIDVLLENYSTFISIGKYVDRIDKGIGSLMTSQKSYSNLIHSLRKDVEEFSFGYSKFLKDTEEQAMPINSDDVYTFEKVNDDEESDFNLDEFLNPKKGDRKWIEEQSERLRVLIDEKKFDECVKLVNDIRACDLGVVEYQTRIDIDDTYNYLIEKLTLAIGRCVSSKEVKVYLEKMKALGCCGLAVDTFLNWLSKKLRSKVQKKISNDDNNNYIPKNSGSTNNELNVIKEEEDNEIENGEIASSCTDKKIIQIISDYFSSFSKSLRLMNEYFNLSSNISFSTYIIPWLKQEMLSMNKQLESLYTQVKSLSELKSIMHFITTLFTTLDTQGQSGKFIYDMYFINNLKITLEAIVNSAMKIDPNKVPFDLKRYEIVYNNKKVILNSVSELGSAIYNVFMIASEFLEKFIFLKSNFIGVVFIEEFFFENILAKEFLSYIKGKIEKNMSNNYDVKPFGDNNESMASSNQILINYGITILSIEKIISFYINSIRENTAIDIMINAASKESLVYMKKQIEEEKQNYFSNLLKVKIESHFYRFFESQKETLSNDIAEQFKEPDRVFVVFFQLIKNIAKVVKARIVNEDEASINEYVKYFILDSQYINFLNIIRTVKCLNEVYDTEFNLKKMGIKGMDVVLYGITYVYFAISKILKFDDDKMFRRITEEFFDEFCKDWGKCRNMSTIRFEQNKALYFDTSEKYVNENKVELLKGL